MRFITYCRVSTDKQGIHGLGMDAQDAAVKQYAARAGEILAAYIEVETGKRKDRPQLTAALDHCRLVGATLLIAKLDRLARNVAFVSALMESGVDFVAADMPTANRLTIHILAAVAEHEAAMISTRTKAALQMVQLAIATNGQHISKTGKICTGLGGYRGPIANFRAGLSSSAYRRGQKATDRAIHILPIIAHIKAAGITSLRGIAAELNNRKIAAARGGEWTATQISRLTPS